MNNLLKTNNPYKHFMGLIVFLLAILLSVSLAWAHGPKGHSGVEFTALQAAKKGFELYDRLVSTEKLKESWETDLTNIEVFSRPRGNNQEIVVKFSRSKGEPQSVYIFFNEKGEYSGSNFTGK
ncbi:MAG: hypothetical protein KAQ71_01725 [Desulfobulbaceae bacterium]|nr:hypothetical protein [Desulfobulbaceae bacterium]